jgi:uncharacterized membrane protein YkoI
MYRSKWILLLLLGGCSRVASPNPDVIVPREQIPPLVLKTALDKFPNHEFTSAYLLEGDVYEIRVKDKQGRTHEIEVNSTGEVLEIE